MNTRECNIHLMPHNRVVKVETGRGLMESLVDRGILLRSDCGGKGVCGKCSVRVIPPEGASYLDESCNITVSGDMTIEIPERSMLSSHIIRKAPVSLPDSFLNRVRQEEGENPWGIAVDLGTTTIAVYLCRMGEGKVISSLSVKNPQVLYGDDVISRIDAVNSDAESISRLQGLTVRAIEWGIRSLLDAQDTDGAVPSRMVVVGNPAMVHILAGISPGSIGVFPYRPAFYEDRVFSSCELGFAFPGMKVYTLPQFSGFLGGDILAAAMAVALEERTVGTLLVDLGTNGELMLKGKGGLLATSCATGPAFEGAALSCGMQAVPGAVDRVRIDPVTGLPEYTVIMKKKVAGASGICGSGVVSTVAELCRTKLVEDNGRFDRSRENAALNPDRSGRYRYILVPGDRASGNRPVSLSQIDIRAVQLGKAALMTGIEFLCREAGLENPSEILIAGAFGSHLDKEDMMTIGMIPVMDPGRVRVCGNAAGAGAVMALCDHAFLERSRELAAGTTVVELAGNMEFQASFVDRLNFPISVQ